MKRKDVYECFDSERDYQDSKWGSPQDEDYKSYPITQFIVDFEVHLNKLKEHAYNIDDTKSLDEVRKIGTLAVKCGEVHGMEPRELGEGTIQTGHSDMVGCGECGNRYDWGTYYACPACRHELPKKK